MAYAGDSRTRDSNMIKCESLEKNKCAFAVSWSGKRCVLEKSVKRSGEDAFTCRTSEIEADRLQNIVETEECVEGCGVDRNTLGISSDSLLDTSFTRKLCSSRCYNHCANVVDLFFNLAAGEGDFGLNIYEVFLNNNDKKKNVNSHLSLTLLCVLNFCCRCFSSKVV